MISRGCLVQYTPVLDMLCHSGTGPLLLVISDPYVLYPTPHGHDVQVVDILDEKGIIRPRPLAALVEVQ
jgi:hypothetical protein